MGCKAAKHGLLTSPQRTGLVEPPEQLLEIHLSHHSMSLNPEITSFATLTLYEISIFHTRKASQSTCTILSHQLFTNFLQCLMFLFSGVWGVLMRVDITIYIYVCCPDVSLSFNHAPHINVFAVLWNFAFKPYLKLTVCQCESSSYLLL